MAAEYEDNFGFWCIDGQEERAFFEHVQRQSIGAICTRCRRRVRLMPQRTLCAACAYALEYGAPVSLKGY
jgi:hypothetical protein